MRGSGLLNDKLAFSCVRGVGEDTEQDSTELLTCIHDNPPPHNSGFADRGVVK